MKLFSGDFLPYTDLFFFKSLKVQELNIYNRNVYYDTEEVLQPFIFLFFYLFFFAVLGKNAFGTAWGIFCCSTTNGHWGKGIIIHLQYQPAASTWDEEAPPPGRS